MAVPVAADFTEAVQAAAASITLTKPANVVSGDLLIILVASDDDSDVPQWDDVSNKPSGFKLIETHNDSGDDAAIAAFYRVADGGEGSTIAIASESSDDQVGFYIRVTGADTGSPINHMGPQWAAGSGLSTHTIWEAFTTVADCLALYFLAFDGGDGSDFTVDAGWTERADAQVDITSNTCSATWGDKDIASAGTTVRATVTSAVVDGATGFIFTINPAPLAHSATIPDIEPFPRHVADSAITLDITMPAGLTTGDLCLILCGNDDTTDTPQFDDSTLKPTGFTLINTAGNSSSDAHVAAFWRKITGSESWPITLTAQSADEIWAIAVRVTGQDATTPIHVVGTDFISSSGTSHAVTGLTTTLDNCRIFYVGSFDGGDGLPMSVSGTGWIELMDGVSKFGSGHCSGQVGTRVLASKGASGAATVTTSVSDGMAAFQFAVAPSVGAPPSVVLGRPLVGPFGGPFVGPFG